MADPYKSAAKPTWTFGRSGQIISASSSDLASVAKAIVCISEGDVTIVPPESDTPIPFVGCPVGFIPPYQVRRVTHLTGQWATVEN
ncbi:hypothetical protein [Devosia elaeis]|uniref:hypothetical protein n=1 Tax=Devosia elaeis TaxID=1770058 RepID=UPI000B08E46D|nr:hypothetical protein [Devosia elaeis]